MSMSDDDLRDEVDNALADEEKLDRAEHDQDDIAEDDSPEDDADSEDDSDSDEDSDEEDDSDDRNRSDKKSDRSATADDEDSEDEDDDPALDFAKPDFKPGSAQESKQFDIRTLKPDPETGLLNPDEVNKAISEHYANQGKASQEDAETERKTRELLTQQWARVSKKYPAVYSKPKLRDLARDMHLSSIGTDNYLTPAQAAARVDRMRRDLTKEGYKSAKTRRSVEKMTTTERSNGRSNGRSGMTDYEKAKKLASSSDPKKASLGRRRMMVLRRQARSRQ